MSIDVKFKNKPKILGLDISTKTIGWALFDLTGSKLLELTHFSPKIKPQPEDKLEELMKKADAFKADAGRIGHTRAFAKHGVLFAIASAVNFVAGIVMIAGLLLLAHAAYRWLA